MSFLWGYEHCESVVSVRRTENARERLTVQLLSLQVSFSLGNLARISGYHYAFFDAILDSHFCSSDCSGRLLRAPVGTSYPWLGNGRA
jgi:hypothetical protein